MASKCSRRKPWGVTCGKMERDANCHILGEVPDIEHDSQQRTDEPGGHGGDELSQVLRSLEGRGLVAREPHPKDTWAKVLHLTPEERSLAAKALPAVDKVDATFFTTVAAERTHFNATLRALLDSEHLL